MSDVPRSEKAAAEHKKGFAAQKGCDRAKAKQCTTDARKDFPAAVTAQSKERCDDVVRHAPWPTILMAYIGMAYIVMSSGTPLGQLPSASKPLLDLGKS